MKFLFVLEHFDPYLGGAEKLFKQVTTLLVEQGHEVEVVTTLFQADLAAKETMGGVKVRRVRCYNRFLFTLFSLPVLFRAARQAAIIHTTTYNAAFPAWLVAKFWRKPSVITYHEHWGKLWFTLPFLSRWQRILYYLFEQAISRLSFDNYIAVSEATKRSLIATGIPECKVHRIYNGVNYDRFKWVKADKTTYFSAIYYGRLGVSKGLDILIPAWGHFVRKYRTEKMVLQLVIPRYPSKLFETITSLVKAHCPPGSVHLLHELPDEELFTTVKSNHLVVIPSYSEGFCFVAAEAVALDMPVISSGRGALAEVVSGKHLHLEALTISAMVLAFEKAYRNEWEFLPRKNFSLSDTGKAYLQFYDHLLATQTTTR